MSTIASVHNIPDAAQKALHYKALDWIKKTWITMPRYGRTEFQKIAGDLIEAADELYVEDKVHETTNGREKLQEKLVQIHKAAIQEKLWGGSTSLYDKQFFDLWAPGEKESYLAVQLATIIARNLECHPVVFDRNHFSSEEELKAKIESSEWYATRNWLQRAWQARFQDIGPGTNTHLRWDGTTIAIVSAVKKVIGDKKLADIDENDLRKLKIEIHENMRAGMLWKNDATGIVEHDVPYERVGYEGPNQNFYVSFMPDNYTIMALVGLIAKSEHVVINDKKAQETAQKDEPIPEGGG